MRLFASLEDKWYFADKLEYYYHSTMSKVNNTNNVLSMYLDKVLSMYSSNVLLKYHFFIQIPHKSNTFFIQLPHKSNTSILLLFFKKYWQCLKLDVNYFCFQFQNLANQLVSLCKCLIKSSIHTNNKGERGKGGYYFRRRK